MKYIIIDWMSNVCFGSDNMNFKEFDEASEWLDDRLCEHHNLKTCDDLDSLREDYSIEEYDPTVDRIMCVGMRYVLKKNYYTE